MWLLWVRGLLIIAAMGAGYLAWVSIHNGPAAGCGPESGCNAVLQSRWAYWLDLPVSVPAVLVYLALLGMTGPYLVRVITSSVAGVGGNVGRLTSIGTLGSLAGTRRSCT